jgi:hypothetical protein
MFRAKAAGGRASHTGETMMSLHLRHHSRGAFAAPAISSIKNYTTTNTRYSSLFTAYRRIIPSSTKSIVSGIPIGLLRRERSSVGGSGPLLVGMRR